MVAGFIAPIFAPLVYGLANCHFTYCWNYGKRKCCFYTLQVLFSNGLHAALTTISAASLLVFCLIYSPCIAAIASIKRELGAKWAFGLAVWQCVLAWILAFVVHSIGILL